jgi:hypothetical protein
MSQARPLHFSGMPTHLAAAFRAGAPDANGQPPEHRISDGDGVPCRHCLRLVEKDEPYLVLAYRPFPEPQPYAEVGPVFIHAEACEAYRTHEKLPERERRGTGRILRGYGKDNRIVYGTGIVVRNDEIEEKAEAILAREDVAYVHLRSATNNCFTLRIDRAKNNPSL